MREPTEIRPIHGALRSRIVAKLAGVTLRQLWYWHNTGLIEAHAIPGAPGCPRLYSWVDYMKVRAAKKLLNEGLTTAKIRQAVDYLDGSIPEWYRFPLYGLSGKILIELNDMVVTADQGRQVALPLVQDILRQLTEEGPLGELRHFSDSVDMNPDVISGNPVVKGTRLEAEFVATLASYGMPVPEIARRYRLTPTQVERAIEFSAIAA